MIINSMLRITKEEWDSLPSGTQARIRVACTYKNPKFSQAMRFGFSTKHIPKDVTTYVQSDKFFIASRGEFRKVAQALQELPYATHFELDEQFTDVCLPDIQYVNEDFEIDERQHRCIEAAQNAKQGIIHAATSSGKSDMILALIAAQKQATLIVVNRKVLLDQLLRDAQKRLKGCTFGTIEGGKAVWGDVTFALERSLAKFLPEAAKRFGMVIADEVHIAAAPSFQKIYNELPAKYRFGFTGTVRRKDGMEFLVYATFGRIIAEVNKDEIIEAGRAVPVELNIHDTMLKPPIELMDEPDAVKFNRAADIFLHESASRLTFIRDRIMEIREQHKDARIVVACRFLEPLRLLKENLEDRGLTVRCVTGKEQDQKGSCDALESGSCDVLLATIPCFSTGVNIPNLTDLILMSPMFSNELLIHQLRGRLMRTSEGKTCGRFHFIWDPDVYDLRKLQTFKRIFAR
ncbi:MAG: DEAD/DEAH box helicase family protein [Patescibacteria group bacterium]